MFVNPSSSAIRFYMPSLVLSKSCLANLEAVIFDISALSLSVSLDDSMIEDALISMLMAFS